MKFISLVCVGFCLISLAISENPLGLSDEQLKSLAKLDPELLPPFLQHKAGDNSHWCCTNDQPVNIVQRTRVEKEIHIVATKIKTGYTSCGFGGWSMCSLYATRYKQVAVYHIGTYEVPDESACLDHHVKCCAGHLEVAGNCMDLATLSQNLDLITQLANLGLIPTVGK